MSFINPCKNCLIISMCEKSCEKLDKSTAICMKILYYIEKFGCVLLSLTFLYVFFFND